MRSKKKYHLIKILSLLLVWQVLFGGLLSGVILFLQSQSKFAGKNESLFKIQHPEMFWWFLLLVPFFVGVVLILVWKNKKLEHFSQSSFNAGVLPNISNWSMFLKLFFLNNIILFSIVSLSNPIVGKANSIAKNQGVEIMVALDISNSMLTDDIAGGYTRLDIAKKALEQLLNQLHGDKIGFVIFAGESYLQMPMTTDYDGAKVFLDPIEPSMISKQGTNISDAIQTAMSGFDDTDVGKTILLITDGEAHDEGSCKIAKEAKESGVLVSAIGMGTTDGGMVPDYVNGKFEGYKKDDKGSFVISKINPKLIQNIAVSGGGIASIANGISLDLSDQLNHVNQMEHAEIDSSEFKVGVSRANWFTFFGFVSLIGFLLISTQNWIKK